MNFPQQIIAATLVVSGCIAGLVLVGRADETTSLSELRADGASASPAEESDASKKKVFAPPQDRHGSLSDSSSARSLVPPAAWLVADFQGDLIGQLPFADQSGACQKVPAPKRVAVALLPPKSAGHLELLIASPAVDDDFWGCARLRIEQAGGAPLAENDRYEVLRSPTGIVARGPGGAMVFLTGDGYLETALSVLSGLEEGASSVGPHARLFTRMHGDKSHAPGSTLDVTLSLPPNWLASVGRDAKESPLRFVSAAFLTSHPDGSAQGGVDCQEEGCPEVLAFLLRAQNDLLATLPAATATVISTSLKMNHVVGTGRIALRWSPGPTQLGALLGKFLLAP